MSPNAPDTVVCTVAALLLASGSPIADATVAVSVTAETVDGGTMWMLTDALALAPIWPSWQLTVAPAGVQDPWLDDTDSMMTPCVRVALSVTPGAMEPPELTVKVWVAPDHAGTW